MGAGAEIGRNPVSKHQVQSGYGDEQTDVGCAGRTRSRDQILRRAQRNVHFPCPADHEQDWQSYRVDPNSSKYNDHTCIQPIKKMFYCSDTLENKGERATMVIQIIK